MPLEAEPARPHDLPDALELLGRAELPEQDVAERWGHYFVVREDDGRVVGVAGLEVHGDGRPAAQRGRRPGLPRPGPRRAARRRGPRARAARCRCAPCTCSPRPRAGYFARHGFAGCPRDAAPAAIDASWEFRTGCPATAVLMMRPVG